MYHSAQLQEHLRVLKTKSYPISRSLAEELSASNTRKRQMHYFAKEQIAAEPANVGQYSSI